MHDAELIDTLLHQTFCAYKDGSDFQQSCVIVPFDCQFIYMRLLFLSANDAYDDSMH